MRGEEEGRGGASSARPLRTQIGFTVGCRDARMGMHAMGYHQLKPVRSGCMDTAAAGRWWECAARMSSQ